MIKYIVDVYDSLEIFEASDIVDLNEKIKTAYHNKSMSYTIICTYTDGFLSVPTYFKKHFI